MSEVASRPILRDACRGFGAPEADLRQLATQLACPVLFAWAERDQIVQLRRNLAAIRRVPNAELEHFPAGHAPRLEPPEEFGRVVERFLRRLDAPSQARSATGM
jgi:pimeloyl-ACP methyl ester carboxylesterase